MGTNTSKEGKEYSQDGLRRFAQNFEFIRSEKDARFGTDIMVYRERSSKKLLALINKATEDPTFTEGLTKEMKMRLAMSHNNLAKVVGYTKSEDETLCGSSHQLSIYNEYYESDLDLEIKDRKPQNEYFQESEIWYVANSLISVGSYFQGLGIYHGDIRPLNVLMDEAGSVYEVDHGILNPHKDNLNKAFSGDKTLFLSPRELEILHSKSETAEYDVYKADVFSAGLTLLYMAHLENPIHLYDYGNNSFNHAGLQSSIADVEKNYSKPLADLIAWMTEVDDLKRPDFLLLHNTMQSQGHAITAPVIEGQTQNQSFSKNQRGLNTPSNIHYDKSPIKSGSAQKNGSSLVNSQISSVGGGVNYGGLANSGLQGVGHNPVPVIQQGSPYNSSIGANQNANVKMGTLYSYPAHYFYK